MGFIERLFGSKTVDMDKVNPNGGNTFSMPSGVAGVSIFGAGGGGGGGSGTTTTTNINQVPGGVAGNITLGSSGNIWINTGTSGSTIKIESGLSKEEQEELKILKEQREEELRHKRIAEFKKLPSELRQFITNALTWKKESDRIGQLTLDKSAREIKLETKNVNDSFVSWSNGTVTLESSFYDPTTPDGLSFEDIKQAHMEAALEEQILSDE